jgi:catechol 2,3-dioxygenase-like lactoylglutathione lyase family enzyme
MVKIPVSDFDRSRVFYRDILGLEEEFAIDAYGWAQYRCGGVPVCLYLAGMGGGSGTPGGETGVQLRVGNARAAAERVGDSIIGELGEADDGTLGFVFADPDGNTFQVIQRDEGASLP